MSLPAEPAVLASDTDRDAAARVLNEAFADGRLTADEHRGRVDAAYAARTWPELAGLIADLPRPAELAEVQAEPDWTLRLDPCLVCLLVGLCPPAGIALLLRRHWVRGPRAQDR